MADVLPEPLVSAEVDLRDFAFTPIYRGRLFGSAFHARVSDAAWRAGVTLWLKSWDQVPAGSLPNDEIDLCRLAELGRDLKTWKKVAQEALWGWVKCSDGRLYHKTVAEGVTEAWERKRAQRDRTAKARAARQSQAPSGSVTEPPTAPVTRSVTEPATEPVTGSKGQGQGQKANHQAPQPDPAAAQAGRAKRFEPIDDGGDDDFRRAERACIAALGGSTLAGGHAPADPAFGPVMLLIDNGFSIDKIVTVLRSEAQRPRRKPIRTWALWAEILAERLAGAARLAPAQCATGADDEPRVDFGGGYSAPLSSIRLMRDRGAWPDQWGPPLGKPGCRMPPELAAQLAKAVP